MGWLLAGQTDKGSLMSLRLAVPQEDNGTLVALPKAKVRVMSEVCNGSESWCACTKIGMLAIYSNLPACNRNSGTHYHMEKGTLGCITDIRE